MPQPPKQIRLVHGQDHARQALAKKLEGVCGIPYPVIAAKTAIQFFLRHSRESGNPEKKESLSLFFK